MTDATDSPDYDQSFWLEADLRTAETILMATSRFWRRQTLG